VPEPDEDFKPEYKYPWQNPVLRKTIYPYRDEELSLFLRIYMEIDLDNPAIPATPVTAEENDKERTRLTEQWKSIKSEIDATKKEQNEEKKITKEKKEVDKEKVAALQDKIVDLSARAHRLEMDLKYLPTPFLGKDKKTLMLENQKVANRRWTAYRHSKLDDAGQDLSHDALLARILDRFDADKDFTRYPKWLRYMVIHFSGMRYDPAHGSYAPPVELIKRLKREQIYSELETASERDVAGRAADAVSELEEELPTLKSPRGARAKQIGSQLDNLKAVEKERASAFGKKGEEEKRAAFQQLIVLEEESERLKDDIYETDVGWEKALVEGNIKKLKELEPQIKALEDKIGAKDLKAERDRLRAAANRRREATIKYEIERADREFSKLDDLQALSVLKAMHMKDAFPDWVWREIVRVTPLKLEEQPDSNWEVVTAEESKQKSQKDPVTEKWRQIMREWEKNITIWREKHGDDLSLVVIRATCNEISEMAQHARGLQPTGGISQKTNWYAKSGSGAYFSQPMADADLKAGASLFFCEWSRKPAKDPVSVVRHDLGTTLKSDSDEPIFDGFKGKNDWTYHFNADKTVTRTRPIGSTADPADTPPQETEYLNWFHEAVVVEVDAPRKRVITFETGPIGIEKRALEDVLKKWHIYIGYAPSGKEPADIDQYLKGILPGR
ncbi:MAG: hypothetical protein JOZ52_02445, partial [Acidobacteria bacterium]|nr:hypothetical protein [Acidobacteriota bacterium]